MSEFMFNPPGFRRGAEILRCADFLGLIKKGGGGFYEIDGNKIRGIDNAVLFLENEIKVRQKLEDLISDRSEELFLDKGSSEEINLLS